MNSRIRLKKEKIKSEIALQERIFSIRGLVYHLGKDDILVIRYKSKIPAHELKNIGRMIRKVLKGKDQPIIFLPSDDFNLKLKNVDRTIKFLEETAENLKKWKLEREDINLHDK